MSDGVIGTTAGNYRILSKVSDGGMGTIYRAEHVMIGRIAAVKVLQSGLTGNREIVNRFFNEAKATTAIKHPGIVEVFDFGYLDSGAAYIVMEFLDGMTLADRIKTRGVMSEGEAATMLRTLCSALAAAHDKGIVHRDLKPDNIFLVADFDGPTGERPKILDFGIAKLTDLGSASAATKTGAVMGTPTYMSPEQCRGSGEVDHRADLYSLGCIFYQLVAGRPPFANQGAGEVIGMHLFMKPDPPSTLVAGISADTEKLIMALLAKDPAHRPQTARDLGQQLSILAHNHGWISASSPSASGFPMPSRWSQDGLPLPTPSASHAPSYTPMQPVVSAAPGQPTTLSGAASQSMVSGPKKSWRGLAIGVVVAVALAGGGVTIGLANRSEPTATTTATPTTPTTPSAAAPMPTPPAPAPVVAAPTPSPLPVTAAPTPAPTPVSSGVTTAPSPTKHVPGSTIASKPVATKKLKKDPKPPDAKPVDKDPKKTDLPIETNVD